MKIKNAELQTYIDTLTDLSKFGIGYESSNNTIISRRKARTDFENYEKDRLEIAQSKAVFGTDGKPVTEIKELPDGTKRHEYVYATPEEKQEIINQINVLLGNEVEIEQPKVSREVIKKLPNISGDLLERLEYFKIITE